MSLLKQAREEVRETKKQVFSKTVTLINGAFALVAALAWNEAIKSLLEQYFKAGSGIYSKFVYAIIVTIVVVIVTSRLSRFTQGKETSQTETK